MKKEPKEKKVRRSETDPIDLKIELEKMDNDKSRQINIIALYIREKKLKLNNYGQLQSVIKRHLRSSQALRPFDNEQILKGIVKAKKATEEWTLETVVKMVTK